MLLRSFENNSFSHYFCKRFYTSARQDRCASRCAVISFRMPEKCVHKGCGKTFVDLDEDCVYHPGPPVFHEGQKGVWTPFCKRLKSNSHVDSFP